MRRGGQDTPRDQIRVTLSSILGWLSNLEDGCSSPSRVAEQVRDRCARIEEIVLHCPDLNEWPEDPE